MIKYLNIYRSAVGEDQFEPGKCFDSFEEAISNKEPGRIYHTTIEVECRSRAWWAPILWGVMGAAIGVVFCYMLLVAGIDSIFNF